MSLQSIDKYLEGRGYNTSARVADYRDPSSVGKPIATAPKDSFVGNLGKSLGGVANFAGKAAYGVAEGFGKGVGAWGHNIVNQFQQIDTGNKMNAQVKQWKDLQEKFKSGKISAQQFQKQSDMILAENRKTSAKRKQLEKDVLSPLDLAKASGETALNVVALVASAGGGQATLKALAGKEGAAGVIGKTAQFGGRALGMDTSKSVGGALLKSQLVAKPSVQTIPQIAKDVSTGNYGGAAINTALLASGGLAGGPLGTGKKVLDKAGSQVSKAIYDTHGLYDVVKLKGGTSVNEAFTAAQKLSKNAKKDEGILKVFQDLAVQEHGKGPNAVAKAIEANQPGGKKFADMTYNEFLTAADSIISDRRKLQAIAKKAGLAVDGAGVVAGRLTPEAKAVISKRLSQADDPLAEFAKIKKEGIPGMSITKDSSKVATSSKPPVKIKSDKNGTMYLAAGKTKITVPKTVQADLDNIANGIALSPERMAKSSRTLNRLGYEFDNKMGIVPIVQKTTQKVSSSVPVRNTNLFGQIEEMVKSGATGEQLAKQVNTLKSVQAALVDGKPVVTKDGRFLAFAKGAGTVKKASEVAPIVQGSKAPLGVIGRTLEKLGLSTKQADPAEQRAIFNKVKDSFVKSIDANPDIKMSGRELLSALNKVTDQKKGVFDIRQLQKGEIAELIGGDKKAAGDVLSAYNNAFKKLGFSERGLGGKLTDFNMRNNPIAPGYSRIQSAARYEINPFFRAQENIETRLGAAALTGKNTMPFTDKYNNTVKLLRDEGVFKNMFAGPAGEGAAGLGAISAKLSKSQQNQIAMTLETFAGGKNNVMKFVSDPKNAGIMQDIKTIVQYPDKGFTSSNFMKALNLAVFPMRYNLKVTQFAAKALAKQPGAVQVQVLKGIKDLSDWQKTPEGIKWSSDNSEAIGVLKYFTPIGTVESALRLLSPGEVRGIKDLGQIGGLPFGIVSRVLQGQGITKSASPYVNPKTGEVVPDQIPKDVKARASQALADIIDTMFTFPGRLVGAPVSKKQLSQGAAEWATLGLLKGGKYEPVTRTDLTAQQKRQQAVLQAGKGSNIPKSPSVMQPRSVSLSSSKPVVITPVYKTSKAKRAKAKASAPGTWRP